MRPRMSGVEDGPDSGIALDALATPREAEICDGSNCATRHHLSHDRPPAAPIGYARSTAPSGSPGFGCRVAGLAGTLHASSHRPPNHMCPARRAAGWVQRLHKLPCPTLVESNPHGLGTRCKPWRINCLYNCGHLPLSLSKVLTHLTSRSITATSTCLNT